MRTKDTILTAIDTGAVEGPIVEKKQKKALSGGFGVLQRLGKSLMLPIAVLPAAGLLLRLGQDDLLGRFSHVPIIGPFFHAMSAAGGALFDNLPLLFALGVAIGFAKKADPTTALAALVGYLVISNVFASMSPVVLGAEGGTINFGVFAGLLIGVISALLFDRYHNKKLPTYLGFFGGRRFVPIVVALASLFLGFILAYIYPLFDRALNALGNGITQLGAVGAFIYGFVNRMLIPLGLHHIVNSYIWFGYGSYNHDGTTVTGELTRFAAGDPTAGIFTSGFYPILMFGLPAAALAMIHMANKKHRQVAMGILAAAALTAFLTGVTEPLEFAFMFVAFPLYVIHAILTGLSLAIAYTLNIHLGFSFSAGLIDLLLYGTAPAAARIPLLVLMGLIFAAIYYLLFSFAIKKWNLRTPGRDIDDDSEYVAVEDDTQPAYAYAGAAPAPRVTEYVVPAAATAVATTAVASAVPDSKAEKLIAAFGGRDNLVHVDACITRLRMEVKDPTRVDRAGLKALGAAGVIDVGNNVQAVFGPQAEILKGEILDVL